MNLETKFKQKTNVDFNAFYSKNRNVLIWHLLKMSKNMSDAEDIADEAIVKALEQLDRYDHTKSQFNTWLFTIANRMMFHKMRTNGRFQSVEEEHGDEETTTLAHYLIADNSTDRAEYEAELTEKTQEAHEAIRSLPQRYASVMMMRLIDGLSYQEIADYLQINLSTLKSRIREGKSLLQQAIRTQPSFC